MNTKDPGSFGDYSMLELFRMEIESQSAILSRGLIGLEDTTAEAGNINELMRAAHSAKGAARIVNRLAAVRIAHAMEDCFVAAEEGRTALTPEHIDVLLRGVDLLGQVANVSDEVFATWESAHEGEIGAFLAALREEAPPSAPGTPSGHIVPDELSPPAVSASSRGALPQINVENRASSSAPNDRVLRIGAENLNRLLELASELRVTSRWFNSLGNRMLRMKGLQAELGRSVQILRDSQLGATNDESTVGRLSEVQDRNNSCQRLFAESITEFELFNRRMGRLSARMYEEVLNSRMRPFGEGTRGLQRVVRDLARLLGKRARLEIKGTGTTVDRDILERLKAPLDHLLRNAVDHGIEFPDERKEAGKTAEGIVHLDARHSGGALVVTIEDDGRGIDIAAVRHAIVERKLANSETAEQMSEGELMEFLFLPGFTLKTSVTEISGRGVGLDVVQTTIREVGGRVRVTSQPGRGTRYQLELPLTLSVMRATLAEIAGEPYAFPLSRIYRALFLSRDQIESAEGRQYFSLGDQQIGLVTAHQALDLDQTQGGEGPLCILVVGEKSSLYGVVVDRFMGESELVVRTLDPRLGKVKNIAAAALMPDGTPLLIIDVDDLVRSIENLVSGQLISQLSDPSLTHAARKRRRILVVDDSLTVRELERKLLVGQGYEVDVAVNGMDGWNAVRSGHYDLVLTDVDMPRLDGIELLTLIRKDSRLKSLPVAIVSYKDREEDRQRGLEAGADYYLTKGSFQDETLVRAVTDLIGRADA